MHKNVSSFLKNIERNKTLFEALELECLHGVDRLYVTRSLFGGRTVRVKNDPNVEQKLNFWTRVFSRKSETYADYQKNTLIPKLIKFRSKCTFENVIESEGSLYLPPLITGKTEVAPLADFKNYNYKKGEFLRTMRSIATPLHNIEFIKYSTTSCKFYSIKKDFEKHNCNYSLVSIDNGIFSSIKTLYLKTIKKATSIANLGSYTRRNQVFIENVLVNSKKPKYNLLAVNVFHLVNYYSLNNVGTADA